MKYHKNRAETLKSTVIVTVWCERISMWEDIDEIYGEIYQDLQSFNRKTGHRLDQFK